jgi:SNF2 family DNA or RNA helicase
MLLVLFVLSVLLVLLLISMRGHAEYANAKATVSVTHSNSFLHTYTCAFVSQTLQAIGLIVSNPAIRYGDYPVNKAEVTIPKDLPPRTTLIVCPVTVIANWDIQIRKYVNVGSGKPVVVLDRYHGPRRKMVMERLVNDELDVVLTSYHTLSAEYKAVYKAHSANDESTDKVKTKGKAKEKSKKPAVDKDGVNIFSHKFYRVVLDEGE